MVRYPIRIPRSRYSGHDEKKRQAAVDFDRDARTIEAHMNAAIKKGLRGIVTYSEIAHSVGLSEERVMNLMFPVDGGHTGITIPDDIKIDL